MENEVTIPFPPVGLSNKNCSLQLPHYFLSVSLDTAPKAASGGHGFLTGLTPDDMHSRFQKVGRLLSSLRKLFISGIAGFCVWVMSCKAVITGKIYSRNQFSTSMKAQGGALQPPRPMFTRMSGSTRLVCFLGFSF